MLVSFTSDEAEMWPTTWLFLRGCHSSRLSALLYVSSAHQFTGFLVIVMGVLAHYIGTVVLHWYDTQDHGMACAEAEMYWPDDDFIGAHLKCWIEVVMCPEHEEMSGKIQTGGHAFEFDVHSGLVSELVNFEDTYQGREFRSSSVQGYSNRGILNRNSKCFVSAIVQPLLVLDKLQVTMLGPDALSGHLGLPLMAVFLETSVANDVGVMLNPELKGVAMKKTPELSIVDSSEVHCIWQHKTAINDQLQTMVDKISRAELSQGIIKVPSAKSFWKQLWDLGGLLQRLEGKPHFKRWAMSWTGLSMDLWAGVVD
jgi:hypothetical protein